MLFIPTRENTSVLLRLYIGLSAWPFFFFVLFAILFTRLFAHPMCPYIAVDDNNDDNRVQWMITK